MIQPKINIRLSSRKDLEKGVVQDLCNLINRVYGEAEAGLFHPGRQRILLTALEKLVEAQALLVAEIENKIVGCVHVELLDENRAKLGMLTVDTNYQSWGIGRELVKTAEKWAIDKNCSIMRLELLTPKRGTHVQKEFLKSWYQRLGYSAQFNTRYEAENALAVPCYFTVYHKELSDCSA
jgi:GNAT superfamily N-acetyltransferase